MSPSLFNIYIQYNLIFIYLYFLLIRMVRTRERVLFQFIYYYRTTSDVSYKITRQNGGLIITLCANKKEN